MEKELLTIKGNRKVLFPDALFDFLPEKYLNSAQLVRIIKVSKCFRSQTR